MRAQRARRRLGLLVGMAAAATFAIAEGCGLEQGGVGPADLTPRDATADGTSGDAARDGVVDTFVPDVTPDVETDADAGLQPCVGPVDGGEGGTTFEGRAPFQTFDGGMFGCSGKVTFANRAQLCNAARGCQPCDVDRWRAVAAGTAPTHQYWTDDDLRITARSELVCFATLDPAGSPCPAAGQPFRVCVDGNGVGDAGARASVDPSGNLCNWSRCGYRDASLPPLPPDGGDAGDAGPVVNMHFGGCSGGATAGTLCCCE